jgi:hypothetical protein
VNERIVYLILSSLSPSTLYVSPPFFGLGCSLRRTLLALYLRTMSPITLLSSRHPPHCFPRSEHKAARVATSQEQPHVAAVCIHGTPREIEKRIGGTCDSWLEVDIVSTCDGEEGAIKVPTWHDGDGYAGVGVVRGVPSVHTLEGRLPASSGEGNVDCALDNRLCEGDQATRTVDKHNERERSIVR